MAKTFCHLLMYVKYAPVVKVEYHNDVFNVICENKFSRTFLNLQYKGHESKTYDINMGIRSIY